jgi:hypothetical protein
MEAIQDWKHIDLKDVDPNFTLLPGPEIYSLRITKAELAAYIARKTTASQEAGQEVPYVKLTLTVVDHPNFTGRKLWESLFPGDFGYKTGRRIMEATGVNQTGTMEEWLTELTSVQPVIKVLVDQVPDQFKSTSTGKPELKNQVNWKGGVQPAD